LANFRGGKLVLSESGSWSGTPEGARLSGGKAIDSQKPSGVAARLFDPGAAGALLSYMGLSLVFFGRGVVLHPASIYIGKGPDPQQYIWFLAWWAHAITHHLNPLRTSSVWVPWGANLAWTTDFPLAACLLYPITRAWGPIVSANVLHLVSPALAGWSAFVLCRYIVPRFLPAWLGGYVFAFSPYMLGGMIGSVFLMLVFPLPLAVRATLRRLAGETSPGGFVTIMTSLLVVQFLLSPEIFASGALFGTIAIGLATRSAPEKEARLLYSTARLTAVAFAASGVILAPYLFYMFVFKMPRGPVFPSWQMCIDLLNFFVPTSLNEIGRPAAFGWIVRHFLNLLAESGGYICPPLIAITVLFGRARWREQRGRFLVLMLACTCVLAMGPMLEVMGHRLFPLPAAAMALVPLLDKAVPARFMVYAFLILAVIVTMWLGEEDLQTGGGITRWAICLAILPFMVCNLSASAWTTAAEIPVFFSDGLYRRYLAPGETVLVTPFGLYGEGMLWQAETEMYFRMAGGYVGAAPPMPEEERDWPIIAGFYRIAGVPDAGEQFKAYVASHRVSAVIVGPRSQYIVTESEGRTTNETWVLRKTVDRDRTALHALLASLGEQPINLGGITLYRITPGILSSYRKITPVEMERRAARARFEALLSGAQHYLAEGGDPRLLDPRQVQQLGLLPTNWFGGPLFAVGDPSFHTRVGLGPTPNGIVVGVEGTYNTLEPIIREYGTHAKRIYFPYPATFSSSATRQGVAMMAMVFDRSELAHITAMAAHPELAGMLPHVVNRAAGN
jgi:hypothetical protein